MKDLKFIFLAVVALPLFSCSQNRKVTESKLVDNSTHTAECVELLHYYSDYWIADSAAKSGFRELLADKFLRGCSLENSKWDNISTYLGRANFILKGENHTLYRYRLNNYSEDLRAPGNMFLDIKVKDGVIINFAVRTMDG